MTEFGRLDITIRDWIRTRFELPSEASKAVGCNPHSGKWNFHFDSELFLAQKPEDGGQDYIGECVGHFARNLDFVGAREWVTAPVIVSPDEIDEHSRTYWDRRKAMGDDIETSGFDSEAAKDGLPTSGSRWTVRRHFRLGTGHGFPTTATSMCIST